MYLWPDLFIFTQNKLHIPIRFGHDAPLGDGFGAKMAQEGEQELERSNNSDLWVAQEGQHGAKTDKKSDRTLCIRFARLRSDFFSILG